tara:strand:+ start:81 stop:437 length:357 start_codon:yes stop_codon:yes gene_type:complete
MFSNEKEILMYYHTSLRNIGLFTSIAVAMSAYSSRIRDRNELKSFIVYIVHFLFLALAIYINYLLINDLQSSKKAYSAVIEGRWIYINYATISFLAVLFGFSSYSLLIRFLKLTKLMK